MKKISLTQGKFALVDDIDFTFLNQWKWCFDGRYAVRKKNNKKIYMHREIVKTKKGFDTDHINRNKIDNQRSNLRSCTRSQNLYNCGLRSNNTSGFNGVSYNKSRKKWEAYLYINGKKKNLGLFGTLESACSYRTSMYVAYQEELR